MSVGVCFSSANLRWSAAWWTPVKTFNLTGRRRGVNVPSFIKFCAHQTASSMIWQPHQLTVFQKGWLTTRTHVYVPFKEFLHFWSWHEIHVEHHKFISIQHLFTISHVFVGVSTLQDRKHNRVKPKQTNKPTQTETNQPPKWPLL